MLDFVMIGLVLLSLIWMIIDWHFVGESSKELVKNIFPTFFNWYNTKIHPNYLLYDAFFVFVFILELFIKWGIAIYNKKHYKWWFYPFINWYDTLGCIPIGSFRILRLVRIYSMIIRLDKKGFIDIKHTGIFRLVKQSSHIVVEEISDIVVDNVLEGIQEEIYTDNGSIEKIIINVIKPKQEILVKWIAERIQIANHSFYLKFNEDIKTYLKANIEKSVENNDSIKKIEKIPVLGKQISSLLQESISDITHQVIESTIKDLAKNNKEEEINKLTDLLFDTLLYKSKDNKNLDIVIKDIVSESIEVIREQVNVKQWKFRERI